MSGARDAHGNAGQEVATKAFDAGVMAVLACVYGNLPLAQAGISSSIGEKNLERIRKLRKKVNGKNAYKSGGQP